MKSLKKISIFLLLIAIFTIFCGCVVQTSSVTDEYQLIRIHIRANSNLDTDQAVKLKVRDRVAAYLEKALDGVTDFETAYAFMEKNLDKITANANAVLAEEGFLYKAKSRLNNEFFPTRSYDSIVVMSGYYDALIIELGDGTGDNWWCVIYPPLCYLEAQGSGDFAYKSKIKEIWDKYFG